MKRHRGTQTQTEQPSTDGKPNYTAVLDPIKREASISEVLKQYSEKLLSAVPTFCTEKLLEKQQHIWVNYICLQWKLCLARPLTLFKELTNMQWKNNMAHSVLLISHSFPASTKAIRKNKWYWMTGTVLMANKNL